MAIVRDPAFWKRFSTAVHLNDVESTSSISGKHSQEEPWLVRQQNKKKRRAIICWAVWASTLIFVAGVVIAIVILANDGLFTELGQKIGASGGGGSS